MKTSSNIAWRFFGWVLEITGVKESLCKARHTGNHKLHLLQYNGMAMVECTKCGCQFIRE